MSPPDAAARVAGWDVGGAHVKLALSIAGRVTAVHQEPCPLWQGLEHLDRALAALLRACPAARDAEHAITMTGEMTDLFHDRAEGVLQLARHLAERLGPRLRFYAGPASWCAAAEAASRWRDVASANWRASATLVASALDDAILVDVGSTTTDFVPVAAGRVLAHGADDASRLALHELAYHGVVRTPLCALARRIPFRGREYNVMNEWFATSADVYRLTGELAPEHDQQPTADNGDKTAAATCARLARMIGHDAIAATTEAWREFARTWRNAQLDALTESIQHVVGASALPAGAAVVGAGCGDFLARELAHRVQRPYVGFDELVPVDQPFAAWARVCAPSVAVACLWQREHERVPCAS